MGNSHKARGLNLGLGLLNGGQAKHNEPMPAPPCAGENVELAAMNAIPADSYVTFVSGLSVVSVKGEVNGKIMQPTQIPEFMKTDNNFQAT